MRHVSPSSAVNVRRATPRDAADIVRLALEVQAVHVAGQPDTFKPGGGETAETVASRMGDPGQLFWVATVAEQAIGYAHARVIDEPESPWKYAARTLVLDQMGVSATHRSRGVGRALWNAVREAATSERVERIILNVWAFNADARRFYERLGFAPLHYRMTLELRDDERTG